MLVAKDRNAKAKPTDEKPDVSLPKLEPVGA
jgi:hypothetical protein